MLQNQEKLYNGDKVPVRGQILDKARAATIKDRHAVYGDPYTDMNCAAEFEAIYAKHAAGKYCPAHDEAMRRVFCKLARIACGVQGHEDSYVDLAAYIAIAAECQAAFMAIVTETLAAENEAAAQSDFPFKTLGSDGVYKSQSIHDLYDRDYPPVVIIKGLQFLDAQGREWEVVNPLEYDKFFANCISDGETPSQMMTRRAIVRVLPLKKTADKATHRCVHCPDKDAYPGQELCQDCATRAAEA